MIRRAALALVIGAIAWVLCIFLGILLSAVGFPLAATIGSALREFAPVIGAIVAAYQFLTGKLGPF